MKKTILKKNKITNNDKGKKDLSTGKKKEKELNHKTKRFIFCNFVIIFTFISTCIICYNLMFVFFNNIVVPENVIKKEFLIILIILINGLKISKNLLIYKFSDINFFVQILYTLLLISMAIGFCFNLLYLISLTSLIIVGLCFYETLKFIDYYTLFFIDLLSLALISVYAFMIYIVCIVN